MNTKTLFTDMLIDFLTVNKVKNAVAEFFDVDVSLFNDPTREQPVTTWRMIAMYFSKSYSSNSLKTIGEMFGERKHGTVLHAINEIDKYINIDKGFRNQMFEVKKHIEKALEIQEEE